MSFYGGKFHFNEAVVLEQIKNIPKLQSINEESLKKLTFLLGWAVAYDPVPLKYRDNSENKKEAIALKNSIASIDSLTSDLYTISPNVRGQATDITIGCLHSGELYKLKDLLKKKLSAIEGTGYKDVLLMSFWNSWKSFLYQDPTIPRENLVFYAICAIVFEELKIDIDENAIKQTMKKLKKTGKVHN